ncbi:MAG: S8 family serine peptidase [Promicromonosporaceae bacterium]|nr:S8 family serine peptidase [Promicromonosporaceae bacterium]
MTTARPTARRRRLLIATAATAALVTTCAAAPVAGAATASDGSSDLYIVQTTGDPVASYAGGVDGLAATKPAKGKKLDSAAPAAKAYKSHLTASHKAVLASAGVAASASVRDYATSFNGFAARLTAAQAADLSKTSGVLRVWKNETVHADAVETPSYLGLDGANGVWATQFGGNANAGAGVIVADIDTGIWPENPAFAALPTPRADDAAIAAKWHGTCQAGTDHPVTCNNKVIGARYYHAAGAVPAGEFASPRDFDGHGSHTASTAAGDFGVPTTIDGKATGIASGMAPAARIAVYKALWEDAASGEASGSTVDLMAAVDDAVADGADVINYSISGSTTYIVDPVELEFMFAAQAGVFVSASAGNSGVDGAGNDTPSQVNHNAPWVTTVAAGTDDRNTSRSVTLGNGQAYKGLGELAGLPSTALVDAANAGLPGASAEAATLCFSDADNDRSNGVTPVLDPAKVAGKIVLCERGTNGRVDKGTAVLAAGGAGIIMYNPGPGSLEADFMGVPSIHVDNVSGAAIKAYADSASSPTATLSPIDPKPAEAPAIADFSSYGPAVAGGGDLLKPDIEAPGVDVIAAVSPANPVNRNNDFFAESGTSMAAPHVAGIAALLKGAHPDWSAMEIKSALMTTATQTTNQGNPITRIGKLATPLNYGSGQVAPAPAFDPGLVYDSSLPDWVAYACGIGQFQLVYSAAYCEPQNYGSIDPSDLNYPSIAIAGLAGSQTVTRTVTDVSPAAGSHAYKVTVKAPTGFKAKVSPESLVLRQGQSASYTVTLTRTTAPLGQWSFGSLTWVENGKGGHSVRSPIAVQPTPLAAPAEAQVNGASGTSAVSLTPGYSGTLTSTVSGLAPATVTDTSLTANATTFAPQVAPWIGRTDVDLTGAQLARFATYDADYPTGTDVDLYVYRLNADGSLGAQVGSSGGGTAQESVTLTNPSGKYAVFAHLYAAPSGSQVVHINGFAVTAGAAGNLTATPASQTVTTAKTATVTLGWSGLAAATRYLGLVTYGDGTSTLGQTIVTALP